MHFLCPALTFSSHFSRGLGQPAGITPPADSRRYEMQQHLVILSLIFALLADKVKIVIVWKVIIQMVKSKKR